MIALLLLLAPLMAAGDPACGLPVAPESDGGIAYDRDTWIHWTGQPSCLNTRHVVLQNESLVNVTIASCNVQTGKWDCAYTGLKGFLNPRVLDVDHVVRPNAIDSVFSETHKKIKNKIKKIGCAEQRAHVGRVGVVQGAQKSICQLPR